MKINNIHSVFFLGVGGIGMSALARWFKANGKKVYGYDKTSKSLTDELQSEGIGIFFVDKASELPSDFQKPSENCLVVYTPAIPQDSLLLNFFNDNDFDIKKRSEVLGLITQDYYTIAVAGTHGKTTTSSMISHILKESGQNVMAFIGGILQNYQSNMILNDVDSDKEPIVIVEADEFDRSFHTLSPDMVILTTVDPDHLDIYGDDKEFIEGFKIFLSKISNKGYLFVNECVDQSLYLDLPCVTMNYGQDKSNSFSFEIKESTANRECFNVSKGGDFELGISGIHNVSNAVGAMLAAKMLQVQDEDIRNSLLSYKGVKRRFEYIVDRQDVVYIDDYAHHPSELESLIDSVKSIYPNKKITAVFQPHLFSRTQDFMSGFAEQLSRVDDLLLMDIYPARELPIEGVTSEVLLGKISLDNKSIVPMEEVVGELSKRALEVVLTVGAGDIDVLINPIRDMLEIDQLIA